MSESTPGTAAQFPPLAGPPLLGLHEMELNFGPQHPSTHGVLRLVLKVDGERIVSARPDVGYLHRGTEKLFETETFPMVIPHTDRMDYVAAATNNHAYCLVVEKLLGVEVPKRAQYIRVLLDEMQRISSHVLWLATAAIDLGAITPFFYTFRDREVILDLFEEYCGARLTLNCMRIGGLPVDLTPGWLEKVRAFAEPFEKCIDEYEDLLTENRIWKERTVGIARPRREALHRVGRHGAGPPGRREGVGRPPGAPVRVLPRARVRHPGREERRHLRPLPRPRRRDPAEPADRPAVPRLAREEPRDGDPREGPARHQAAGRRGLRLRRGAEGRARLPPRRQRREQAVPPPREAPELHQPPGPPGDGAGPPRRGPRGRHRDDRHRPRRSRPIGTRCPRPSSTTS